MEFPDLGDHCSMSSCRQLDFLPFECIGCKKLFCRDHYLFDSHQCPKSHEFDNQVPACPLCQKPVPVGRNELADVRMNRHIEQDCEDERAMKRKRSHNNRCSLSGCKKRELIPVLCNQCARNYCLKHRHPMDHACKPSSHASTRRRDDNEWSEHLKTTASPRAMAAKAALARLETGIKSTISNVTTSLAGRMNNSNVSTGAATTLSEDEALARAIQLSMQDQGVSSSGSSMTEEERQLQEAIRRSKKDQGGSKDKCRVQ